MSAFDLLNQPELFLLSLLLSLDFSAQPLLSLGPLLCLFFSLATSFLARANVGISFGDSLEARIDHWFDASLSPIATATIVTGVLASDILLPIPSSFVSTLAGSRLGFVGGTAVVLEMARRYGARYFVLVSTDKAVEPHSVMGATKRLAELYVQWLHETSRRMSGARNDTFKM